MVNAVFEFDGDVGVLRLDTHFGAKHTIFCRKQKDESFRLGGTAINEIAIYEGVILELGISSKFRAFISPNQTIEDVGILSPEEWDESDLHCFVIEYYPLDMEGEKHKWLISKNPLQNCNRLFINLDVLDGGGNTVRRWRISPFTGEFKIIDG